MVDESAEFELPVSFSEKFELTNTNSSECLTLVHDGDSVSYNERVAAMVTRYIKFSGLTFPDVLVPLMKSHDVMIHPTRPLVIYRSMMIELSDNGIEYLKSTGSNAEAVELELTVSTLEVSGKKAEASLNFVFSADGTSLGNGSKRMILGGLRPYDQTTIDDIVTRYNSWRDSYSE